MSDDYEEGLNRELLQEWRRQNPDIVEFWKPVGTAADGGGEPIDLLERREQPEDFRNLQAEFYASIARLMGIPFEPESPHDRAVREQRQREAQLEAEKQARRQHLRVVK